MTANIDSLLQLLNPKDRSAAARELPFLINVISDLADYKPAKSREIKETLEACRKLKYLALKMKELPYPIDVYVGRDQAEALCEIANRAEMGAADFDALRADFPEIGDPRRRDPRRLALTFALQFCRRHSLYELPRTPRATGSTLPGFVRQVLQLARPPVDLTDEELRTRWEAVMKAAEV